MATKLSELNINLSGLHELDKLDISLQPFEGCTYFYIVYFADIIDVLTGKSIPIPNGFKLYPKIPYTKYFLYEYLKYICKINYKFGLMRFEIEFIN